MAISLGKSRGPVPMIPPHPTTIFAVRETNIIINENE
jgi:hypothetical protein